MIAKINTYKQEQNIPKQTKSTTAINAHKQFMNEITRLLALGEEETLKYGGQKVVYVRGWAGRSKAVPNPTLLDKLGMLLITVLSSRQTRCHV